MGRGLFGEGFKVSRRTVSLFLGSEARERGSAVRLGRKTIPATRTISTTSIGRRLLRMFSLLVLAGFTRLTMADLRLNGKRGII